MTDYKALCAELVQLVDDAWDCSKPKYIQEFLDRTRAALAEPELFAAQAVHCPVCGVAAEPKRYGPFFIDPVYRVAMTCPHHHWRGRMCETTADAIAAELEAHQ
jgi:hypothetical protein